MDVGLVATTVSQGYAVGWGALALINAGLAQGKNRSGLNWFLISLLLGPLATLALLFRERVPAERQSPAEPAHRPDATER